MTNAPATIRIVTSMMPPRQQPSRTRQWGLMARARAVCPPPSRLGRAAVFTASAQLQWPPAGILTRRLSPGATMFLIVLSAFVLIGALTVPVRMAGAVYGALQIAQLDRFG